MRIILVIALTGGTLAGAAGHAQGVDCDQAVDQASLNFCADRGYEVADQQLNAAYRRLVAGLAPADADRLKVAQRAWIAYRDATCAFVGGSSLGGSIHPMVVSDCLATLTDAQTALLRQQSTCEEGDVSCVGR